MKNTLSISNGYNVILLAYEITKGMKSIGSKSLMPVKIDNHTDTLIQHQINSIKKHVKNVQSINIVSGFDKEKLKKKIVADNQISVIDNNDYDTLGQSHAICLALKQITNKFPTIIISNHLILRKNIFQQCKEKTNHIFCIKNCNNKFFKIGCTHDGGKVEYLCYELSPKWSEIFLLQTESKKLLESILESNRNMLLFEAINMSLAAYPTENTYIYNNSLITVTHK